MSRRQQATPEEPGVVVVDAEDYNRQQRFKEIHEARQRVAEYMASVDDKIQKNTHDRLPGNTPSIVREQLAYRVSLYVMELLPLLEQQDGSDPYMSDEFDDRDPVDDLKEFALASGQVADHGGALEPPETLRVFQVANLAYSQLGMELELDEETGDSGFEYSDLLEEES